MFPLRIITLAMTALAVTALAMTAAVMVSPSLFSAAPVADESAITARADEISAQRHTSRRPPRPARRPADSAVPQYRAGPDPSIAPDGRPYRVPEYLRNQCYVDDGYGRFSACSNR